MYVLYILIRNIPYYKAKLGTLDGEGGENVSN
jgi:hypothetical protein